MSRFILVWMMIFGILSILGQSDDGGNDLSEGLEETLVEGEEVFEFEIELAPDDILVIEGFKYEDGEGVDRNYTMAIKYYNESAALGNDEAMYALGFLYGTGKGGPVNRPLSNLYHAFAAQGGNIKSTMTLAYKLMMGHALVKSCPKAAQRYEIVAASVVHEFEETGIMRFKEDYVRLSTQAESVRDKEKEQEEIIQYYTDSAETGDPAAQVTVGTLHLYGGYGVQQDDAEALRFFRMAAAQQDPSGTWMLGHMYLHGINVTQDNTTALKLFRSAADKGHPQANRELGWMHLHGYGVPPNLETGMKLLKLAADMGSPEAQVDLADLYYDGVKVKLDYTEAYNYYTKAMAQGHLTALYKLAVMHHYGLGTVPHCQMAVQLYKRVAERSSWGEILHEAYEFYEQGDYERSLRRYEEAAEMGFEVGQSNAGFILDNNLVPKYYNNRSRDLEMALEYYRDSAEQKNPGSLLKIGDYYYEGMGAEVNFEKAAKYYQAASELRSAQATFNLGYMHQLGLGLPKDLHLAKRNYDMAYSMDGDAWLAVGLALAYLATDFMSEWVAWVAWDSILLCILFVLLIGALIVRNRLVHHI
eukprot:TRINITY_DN3421_c0_g1_i1.p1 TRINITY_DN3421_c0_g1~~TRINITY_DN3421_c0_g1_i1.p1  ORF type:complete len:587 (+),score=139.97 TRINITY_DN3421_c0_g1_i1:128-1888(+)